MTLSTEKSTRALKKLKVATLRRVASKDGVTLTKEDALVFVEAFPTVKSARVAVLTARGKELMPQLRRLFAMARHRVGMK